MILAGVVFCVLAMLNAATVGEWEDFFRGVRFVVFWLLFIIIILYDDNKAFFHQIFDIYRETFE